MKRIRRLVASLMLLPTVAGAQTADISVLEIIGHTLRPETLLACVEPKLVGVCVFLGCGPTSCGLQTTLKIEMWQPDFVVSTFDEPGNDPIREARLLYGPLQRSVLTALTQRLGAFTAGAGQPITGVFRPNEKGQTDLRFKACNVYGHPLAANTLNVWLGQILGVSFSCPSETTPGFPYYQSALDPLGWRWNFPERFDPRSVIPGYRRIGGLGYTWSTVHPRFGFAIGYYPPKIHQVLAWRAASLVTDPLVSPRAYVPSWQGRDSTGFHMEHDDWPGEVDEAGVGARIQMLHPETDQDCRRIAADDSLAFVHAHTDDDPPYDNKRAVHAVWRKYRCCPKPAASDHLFTISLTTTP